MDRNSLAYAEADYIDVPRSHWEPTHTHKTTFNAGDLVPLYFDEDIMPGLTLGMKTSFVIRMQTPIYPTMDNLVFDYWWFRAPKYWYWEHFKEQMGQNSLGAWSQTIEYTTPQINVTTAYGVNDLASYMGVPIGVTDFKWDRLGINFYCGLWNNWFRSTVLQAPIIYDTTDSTLTSDGTILTGYGLLPLCKTHDYFTSGLIEPTRNLPGMTNGVTLPLGTTAPIKDATTATTSNIFQPRLYDATATLKPANYSLGIGTGGHLGTAGSASVGSAAYMSLEADLTNATAASLNALYLANATQRLLYLDAEYGTIYRDILRGYGVTASSQDTMIEEYLGGQRVPINIETVLQNSETTTVSPLGNTGAFSVTANVNEDFVKSFTTHDMLICVGGVRILQHTYQQGLARQFSRLRRLDHYHPALSHIANQPVYEREIYLQADSVVNSDGLPVNDEVFNYKEAWQEYMYKPNRISGELLSTYNQSLDAWHYGDDYSSAPVFDDDWIVEDKTLIDRTLAVQSSEAHQFVADFYFEESRTAPIPMHRIPGLIGFTHM